MPAKRLLIVGHVPSPNTQALRDAVLLGARYPDIDGIDAVAQSPLGTGPRDVLAADAIILGTTENLGYMSGAMKDFFDRIYYPVLEEKQGLPFALYVRAALDGTGTIRAIDGVTTGLRWKQVREPLWLKGDWRDSYVDDARELGTLIAAGLEAGIF